MTTEQQSTALGPMETWVLAHESKLDMISPTRMNYAVAAVESTELRGYLREQDAIRAELLAALKDLTVHATCVRPGDVTICSKLGDSCPHVSAARRAIKRAEKVTA